MARRIGLPNHENMRSAAAFAAVTSLFAGTLVGGLHSMGSFDPALLRGPQNDHLGEGRSGWKVHSHALAGYSIQLPPKWEAVEVDGATAFRELDRKRHVVARLTIVPSDGARRRPPPEAASRFIREDHVLTFWTSRRLAAHSRVFQEAAESFRTIGSA
jgi:hypothetical protein